MSTIIRTLVFYAVFLLLIACGGDQQTQTTEESPGTAIETTKAAATDETTANAISVEVTTVQPQQVDDTFSLPAYAEAWDSVDVRAPLGGDVVAINAVEGRWVRQGAQLLRLDSADFQSNLDYARKAFENARLNFERVSGFYQSGIVSLREYEDAESLFLAARSSYTQGQSNLDKTLLTAPISGYIDRVLVENRETLNPGQVTVKMVNIERMRAVVALPEKDVGGVSIGDRVDIEVATYDSPRFYEGVVRSVSYNAEQLSRSYRCTVEILAPNDIRPGMVLRVNFVRESYPAAILAPLYSLLVEGRDYSLFVARDGKAVKLTPDVGAIIDDSIIVKSGLAEGDQLIIRGQQYLADSAPISIVSSEN